MRRLKSGFASYGFLLAWTLSSMVFSAPSARSAEALSPDYFPVRTGLYWVYRVEPGQNELKLEVGASVFLDSAGTEVAESRNSEKGVQKAWRLILNGKVTSKYFSTDGQGLHVIEKREVGFSVAPTLVTIESYRWDESRWKFTVLSGYLKMIWSGSRVSDRDILQVKDLRIPAVSLQNGDVYGNKTQVWLAKGVGLVQQEIIKKGPEKEAVPQSEKWTLVDAHEEILSALKALSISFNQKKIVRPRATLGGPKED